MKDELALFILASFYPVRRANEGVSQESWLTTNLTLADRLKQRSATQALNWIDVE